MAPNSTTGLLWVATLCVTFVVTLAKTPYLEDKFEIDQALGAAFNKMVLHNETGKLYVGAVNRLYIFDKDLTDIQTLQTGPKMDNPDCLPKVNSDFECDKPLKETAVYTKALLIDYDNEVLIACSNLYQGVCGKYNLTSLQKILPADKSNRFPFQPMVANNDSATTVLFIALGPKEPQSQHQRNALYCGVSYTINGSYREKIPSMATRSLSDFSLVYKETFVKTQTMIESTLRESFHVYFIYGFGSEKFSYMVTVQKQSPNTENYVTKMLRVCQNDTSYFSYAEVYLQCYHEGVMYNLSQAAYTGKAGIHLAKALEIPTTEDVLYVVFASGSTSPGSPGSKSAVCVYPLREIRAVFSKNIQECFEGVGNTGPNHIITPQRCSKTNTLVVDDNYCGDHRVNYPIDGTIPITAEAAVTFNKTASAITVSVNSGNTVAFVGTTSGHVIKIALEAQDYGIAYEDVAVAEGQKINSDMFVDTQKQSLYVMTDWKLMKLKLYECSQYTTCDACLGASDPYCGWCSLENKCSLRMECTEFDQDLRWLPYNSESCTMISEVIPDKIQKGDRLVKHLQLNVSSLPRFQDKYQCRFRGYGMDILTTDMKLAHNTNNIIMCETPEPNQLPPIPTGEDHIVMKLTVQIGNRDFVSTQFTIFDCDVHMSCTECSLTDFPCTWCINNHLCRYNTSESCTKNELVHGKNSNKTPEGPNECPRIELEGFTDEGKIFVPSGMTKEIQVKVVNLRSFQTPIECFFIMNPATKKQTKSFNTNGSSTEVTCDPVRFSYRENVGEMNVPFSVYAKNQPLDNPENIQVIMYKCEAMASTCGECLYLDKALQCGWCGDDTCTIAGQCQKNWLPRDGICSDVRITSITPLKGPTKGGTSLTIIGVNLGINFKDINGNIQVGGVTCNPQEDKCELPLKIVCITGVYPATGYHIKPVNVQVYVGREYSATAPMNFTYVDPILTEIIPSKGPLSGGTRLQIRGQDLDAGTHVEVRIGRNPCTVVERQSTMIVCLTGKSDRTCDEDEEECLLSESVTAVFDNQNVLGNLMYHYINDPIITNVQPLRAIVSGGIKIAVSGEYLDSIQTASMILTVKTSRRRRSPTEFVGDCTIVSTTSNKMTCHSPRISNGTVLGVQGKKFTYGFKLDNVFIDRGDSQEYFTIYPDPVFEEFAGNREKSYQSKTDNYLTINGKNLNLGFNTSDVIVRVGTEYCNVTSIDKYGNQINCKPPKSQPSSMQGYRFPEVVVQVGRNLTKVVGYLKYESPEILPLPVIIGLGVAGGVLILVVMIFVVLWCIKSRENSSMKKKWQIQMDNLEVKVAKECKEAFAELQTDMTELTNDNFGQIAIPFWDYRTYCMRVLFPQDEDSHPVIKDLDVDPVRREQVEHGLRQFMQLLCNKTFLLIFIRTLEANKKFSMRDRVNVASLISVALQTRMEYATEILKTLLSELIEKAVEGKNHPKLLLRRTESVAEKMLTNWFTFLLYKFLRECAGEPLFMLYQAIKQQTSKGPVDSVTSEARYSLSEDKLIRQQIDYKPLTIYVQDLDQFGKSSHPVKVLDCDTVSQVKEKILDAIYKNAPFSSRPFKTSVDLVLFAKTEWEQSGMQKMVLTDIDTTTKQEGDYKRLNTLAHFQVPDQALMALVPKQNPSIYDLSISSDKSFNSKGYDYRRLGDNSVLYSSRSPSLNRTGTQQNTELMSENGIKYYHLVKTHEQEGNKEGDRGSKMVSEIYLTRLLASKGTLQQYVDDLFERIFSTVHRCTSLPLAIKYMFDFLDDQALLHGIQEPDVVHTWKSNSLPLRFWVNVIKNPNFVFDIYKSNIVDSCLSVVAQNFMDSCSMSDHKLGKDSPSSKLLYAKDIPTYKKWVDRYYQDIKMMPAISDQDMTAMMTEESRSHQDEFNINAALYELYKYMEQYREDLFAALEEDEFARKNKLSQKMDQLYATMTS